LRTIFSPTKLLIEQLASTDFTLIPRCSAILPPLSNSAILRDIPDLNLLLAVDFVDVDVDWEMGVDVSHLVLVSLGDTDDEVLDERLDGAESSDILAVSVVELDLNNIRLWFGESDVDVLEVLGELSSWSLDGNDTGLDGEGD
jgi:hypothetical protein